jgi:hypothetical protein
VIRRVAAGILLPAAGVLVACAAGVVSAVVTLLLVPLRLQIGDWLVRIPAAVVIAVAGNWLLLWFARQVTGWRWAVLAPVAGWFLVMLPALGATAAGDRLLMPDDWVGTLTLFGGTIVLTIGTVLALVSPRHQPGGSSLGPILPQRRAPRVRSPFTMTDHEDSST